MRLFSVLLPTLVFASASVLASGHRRATGAAADLPAPPPYPPPEAVLAPRVVVKSPKMAKRFKPRAVVAPRTPEPEPNVLENREPKTFRVLADTRGRPPPSFQHSQREPVPVQPAQTVSVVKTKAAEPTAKAAGVKVAPVPFHTALTKSSPLAAPAHTRRAEDPMEKRAPCNMAGMGGKMMVKAPVPTPAALVGRTPPEAFRAVLTKRTLEHIRPVHIKRDPENIRLEEAVAKRSPPTEPYKVKAPELIGDLFKKRTLPAAPIVKPAIQTVRPRHYDAELTKTSKRRLRREPQAEAEPVAVPKVTPIVAAAVQQVKVKAGKILKADR